MTEKSEIASSLDWGRVRTAMVICALMLFLYISILIGGAWLVGRDAVVCFQFVYFRGAIGIPSSIIASVSIVALLAAGTKGDFKINVWGLYLEGPSAPIMLWVVCFLSINLSMFMLLPEINGASDLPPVLSKLCDIS